MEEPFLPDLCRVGVALGVILVTELVVIAYVLSLGTFSTFDWEKLALLSLYAQWVSLLSILGLCHGRDFLNARPPVTAATLSFLWILLAATLANTGAQWVYASQSIASWSFTWWLRDVCITAVVASVGLRYLFMQQRWQNEERAKTTARIDALHARIKPHFLFNSMNTIASLIGYAPDEAERAVEDLSSLLRASLSSSDDLVSWQTERDVCEAYLRIEQQRLGDRLQVEWSVDALPAEFYLPPLVLQPLVENAIYHGIENLPEGGSLKVFAELRSKLVELRVVNPVADAGNVRASGAGHGIALENIRARLQTLFASYFPLPAELDLQNSETHTVATLRFPLVSSLEGRV